MTRVCLAEKIVHISFRGHLLLLSFHPLVPKRTLLLKCIHIITQDRSFEHLHNYLTHPEEGQDNSHGHGGGEAGHGGAIRLWLGRGWWGGRWAILAEIRFFYVFLLSDGLHAMCTYVTREWVFSFSLVKHTVSASL